LGEILKLLKLDMVKTENTIEIRLTAKRIKNTVCQNSSDITKVILERNLQLQILILEKKY
jgi:hypothetical protein